MSVDSGQFGRFCRLWIETKSGSNLAVDLSDFRIKFSISQNMIGKPCTATIYVYNVSGDLSKSIAFPTNEIMYNSGQKVYLDVGYGDESNLSQLFCGDLFWKTSGRESETDTFMLLVASTGGKSFANSFINKTLQKGASQRDVIYSILDSMKCDDVSYSSIVLPETPKETLYRGKAIYGFSSCAMDNACRNCSIDWGYGNTGIKFINSSEFTNTGGEIVYDVNSINGLIGRPKLTPNGVELRTLLNPSYQHGTLIRIDNKSIQRDAPTTEYSQNAFLKNYASTNMYTDADGTYRVISARHSGDSRGNEWYSDLSCVAVTGVTPQTPSIYNSIL